VAQKHITFCRICEATCGLEVETEDNRVTAIRPDPEHVVSRGYACVKGTRYGAVQHSTDRILQPLERVGDRFEEVSWERAISEIARRSRAIIDRDGPNALGHFVGSAGGANVLAPLFRGALWSGLGSTRMYGTGSCDTVNKFRVNEDMYGSPMRLAHPDVNRTQFLMVLGANPVVSGNTLYHLPRAGERFAAIAQRGGRAVFINPRRIESAARGEHYFIRPDTDLFFLSAFAAELIRLGAVDRDRVASTMRGFETFERCVAPWTPERQALVTGVPAETLRELARAHAEADGAALYMATGVNQGRTGTLCFWLLEVINAFTGNLDAAGGTLMGHGLIDMAEQVTHNPQMMTSYERGDGLPTVSGQQPAGMLASDIERGAVRGLFVEASNPLLACSTPNGRLEASLAKLELLVSVDHFRNETGDLAHFVLPATTWLERPEIPYALQSLAGCCPTPYMIYADAVLEPPPGVRHEWWIYARLADVMQVPLFGSRLGSAAAKLASRVAYGPFGGLLSVPHLLIGGMLKQGGLPGPKQMTRDHPHGLLLPEKHGGDFLGTERVLTADGLVDLAPKAYVDVFETVVEARYREEVEARDSFKVIGMRQLKRMNTSSSNCEALVKEATNYAYVSPQDAEELGVRDGDVVEVTSGFGRIEIPVRVTDEMMPRTMAIPQCWGHGKAKGLRHAVKHPGVNSNYLAGDGAGNIEGLSGMSHLSGIVVAVKAATM
jgi:anaerobic selenocysteine-containing dehydrogenase